MKKYFLFLLAVVSLLVTHAQSTDKYTLLKPDRVFDGDRMQTGWVVLVKNNTIEVAGVLNFKVPPATEIIDMKGMTLLPGLIEGHSHLFLHPYNETPWDDQVLKESRAERTARAVNHAKATLMAGFTTVRDLGTEGAMYDDVGLKKSIQKGIISGPEMIVSTRAIVAKGTYGPKSPSPDVVLPQGAAEVSNANEMVEEVRTQISKGADFIKIYADYRWGPDGTVKPTFTVEEISEAVKIAGSSGRQVVAHATSPEGMRRAVMAGVSTIEHGDDGTEEIFTMMKEKNVAFCPTLAAGEAIEQYRGWKKGVDPEPESISDKKKSFAIALKTGVSVCMGGDVGVFAHGDNAREMELMVEYGMKPIDVLTSTTSVNADAFGYGGQFGRIKTGLLADLVAVEGDPSVQIQDIRKVKWVMKNGIVYKK
jgi:imidazolonepropionase-like amidohydrolase